MTVVISYPPHDDLKILARRLQTLAVAYGLKAKLQQVLNIQMVQLSMDGGQDLNACRAMVGLLWVRDGLLRLLAAKAVLESQEVAWGGVEMSGGHWQYGTHCLQETSDALERLNLEHQFLRALQHELDWGHSGDSCLECARLRVISGLDALFTMLDEGGDFGEILTRLKMGGAETVCSRHSTAGDRT